MGQEAWLDLAEVGPVVRAQVVLVQAVIHLLGLAGHREGRGLEVGHLESHRRTKRSENESNGSGKCMAMMPWSCSDSSGRATRHGSPISIAISAEKWEPRWFRFNTVGRTVWAFVSAGSRSKASPTKSNGEQ